MNKRIKELWEQSQTRQEGVETFYEGLYVTRVTDNYEKFAELIIKECIHLALNEKLRFGSLNMNECAAAIDNYRLLLKEHFGVK